MIHLTACAQEAHASSDWPITTGSVGLPVALELSDDFDGLAVTLCFEAGDERADVAYLGDPVAVPSQCLTTEGATLRIGVYGALPNGTIVIPTVWATVGLVRKGATPSGVDPAQPEPDWTAQVLEAARDAKETAERIEGEVDEWAEAEAARVRAEDARDSAEAARRSAEQARAGAESIRADAETNRVAAEGIRITNESARTSNELARTTAEQSRATAETGRALAETARAEAEQVRATAETARNGAEAARAQAEQQRADAERQRAASETARATAEQARATAEQGRAAAETARAEAETLRATAEQGRADAEASRAQSWAELEADAEQATEAATEAAAALRPEVDWLRGNQLTKEVDGELFAVSDAYGAPMLSLGVDGKSEQASTTGRNLVDPAKMANGYIANDGIVIGSTNTYKHNDYIPVTPGTTYTISQGGTAFSGSIRYVFYDADKQALSPYYTHGSRVSFQLTAPEGAAFFRGSFNGPQAQYAMFEEGSSYTGFEPYTGGEPSPRPDWPQEIASVDAPSVTLAGKNLISDNPEDYFHSYIYYAFDVPAIPNATYTYSRKSGSGNEIGFVMAGKDSETNPDRDIVTLTYRDRWTFTNTEGFKTFRFRIHQDGVNTIKNKDLQFELGNAATSYTPYVTTTTVPLYDGTLRSLPDGTKDELHLSYLRPSTREGWAWYQATLTALVGETTTAATDGVTGTVGVDVMSTTGEIADGPTVLYKLASAHVTDLGEIELPVLPSEHVTVWADPTTGLAMEYVRDTNIVIASLEAAYADLATS